MSQAVVLALIAVLCGSGAAALITAMFQRPKTRAEAAKLIAESGEALNRNWEAWASKLEAKVATLEALIQGKDAQIAELRATLEREKWVTRLVISWALTLRDEIIRLSGGDTNLPPPPIEVQAYLGDSKNPRP